jgi:type IV pilus assembly protein PilY1
MKSKISQSGRSNNKWRSWSVKLGVILGLAGLTVGVVLSAVTLPPVVDLPAEPLYMNGAKSKGNLTLALSVEFPTVGQTYRDNFDSTKEYVGYFDPKSCYNHVPGSGGKGAYFDWSGKATTGSCGGGGFNGNFLNWATSSAVDILRYGLTGGNRTTDESSGNGLTIVERAWLPDDFYRNGSYFTEKVLPNALVKDMIETSVANKIGTNDMYIYNCRDRVYFAKSKDTTGGCTNPFGVANAVSDQLVGPNNNTTFYEVRNLVCDPNSATNRLMTYDPATKKWAGLCFRYPNGKYKPVGQFQMNAESLRVSVFSYLQDNNRSRYGGVLRSPLKYLGPKSFDSNFNLDVAANANSEWNASTGVFIENPQNGNATYGAQGYPRSGATMYINKFGTLNPDTIGSYKGLDPVSELYYEAIRYLQGKNQPTPEAVADFTGTAASVKALKENFPAYSTWTDPFAGFTDTTDSGKGCLRNSIVTIADVFTHSDRSVPGNTNTTNQDFARSADTNPPLDIPFWTSVVGSFESKTSATATLTYTDNQGRTQKAGNLASNTLYPSLVNAATMDTGSTGGSYYMAGLAYWANTQSFRTDLPKGRITTYSIDVNESRSSDDASFRRQRQLYLGAKYGGFDNSAAGNTGNPYAVGTNVLWQATDGDAKNYFLVSDAAKFLDSLSEVFARIVEETGSIAGGAISTQRLTVGQTAAVYQARFNPVANFWSGRLFKFPLSLDGAGTGLVIGTTPTWEAGDVLTKASVLDNGAGRNIVIGAPIGKQATVLPTPFKWADLTQDHKDALNISPYAAPAVVDTLGSDRLDYIRGDQRKEIKPSNPLAPFRPRDIVLGDIVNSGLVYMGAPAGNITGAAYSTFYAANKSRKPVLFTNANDGMLHAFYDSNGKEAFAYIPGFTSGKLNRLPDQDYTHLSINDSTPAIAEAMVGTQWRSVLVSGTGGGGQGIFALDVTNPETFSKDNVMWEFTERDHPAMGNVIGSPQILKMRTSNYGAAPTYKWYAVVASGVNNYAADGYAHATGDPSIFIIDLSRIPSAFPAEAPWTEGVNFWRIEIPQTSTAIAKGMLGFTAVKNVQTDAVDSLYAGDLQGNVWKLDFTLVGTAGLTANATTNLTKFNYKVGTSSTFYVAKDSTGALQPITGEPAIINAFFDSKLVAFGTGKYLESLDTSVPLTVGASFYSLLDNATAITGRTALQAGTISASTVTVPSFVFGKTAPAKMGWYVDFDKSIGERQISDITAEFGQLFFGSIFPTKGSCGEGGGQFYAVNSLTGKGVTEVSKVGILAAPLVLEIGNTALTNSDTSGQRTATRRVAVIMQGSKDLKVASSSLTYNQQVGRLSWRQINNYRENKNAP